MTVDATPHRGLLAPTTLGVDDAAPENDPRRLAVRRFLAAHPSPRGAELAEAGLVAPHWPPPWGLGADPEHQLVIDDELRRAGVARPVNPIGIGWAGPTILAAGTETQQARWLPGILSGEEFWCQLFSEPDAGSDLVSLATRARREGDHWVVTGQKTWTSYAHLAKWGILLARTGQPGPRGITYFVCPMDAPGVSVRPLVDMTGDHAFNEVFLDEVVLADDLRLGEVDDGWRLAKVTLANERVALSGEGVLWGRGPTARDLVDLVVREGLALEPGEREALVRAVIHGEVLRLLRGRITHAALSGASSGATASVRKALADDHGQEVMGLAVRLAHAAGMLADRGPGGVGGEEGVSWAWGFLYAQALTIGGGTAVVQRNIIAERVLGLPREPA
ncbi:MAG TPA: acyl-CoA dehydrogenase family protein [Acidimicrobiales bacterium]|nr:acyl-CoA dehydrogenase family protein [Acidimicrobiales bacterium]